MNEKTAKGNLAEQSIQDLIDIIDGKKKIDETTEKNPVVKAYQMATKLDEARIDNPDISLLIEIVAICSFCLLLYFIWPYLSADNSIIFSKADLLDAKNIPSNSFSVGEMTKINNEVDALSKYFEYFKSAPYSLESQGIPELARGVIFLPIIAFVATFVVPPIIALYILWFVFKYWKMVIEATWGWFVMMYEYGTGLIEGKLGCKWYIKMVTGWGCHSPSFQTYFDEWRKTYIEVPAYHEKLAYVDKYTATKAKYISIPKLKYIDTPLDQLDAEGTYLKELAIDRTGSGFLRNLAKLHNVLYEKPRDQIYKWIINDNHAPESNVVKQLNNTGTVQEPNSSKKKLLYGIILFAVLIIIIGAVVYFYPTQSNNFINNSIKTMSKI